MKIANQITMLLAVCGNQPQIKPEKNITTEVITKCMKVCAVMLQLSISKITVVVEKQIQIIPVIKY